MITDILGRLSAGDDLSLAEMSQVVDSIMQGQCSEQQIAMLLTALSAKGETVDELAGAAAAMRKHMTPICSSHANLVDTCGPGGVSSGTFNISTTAALVTAAAGIPVAKHGNRSVTSRSGSADVLAALGVNIEADLPTVEHCLETLGICFCFAPLMHPAMKHVVAVRKKLGIRTIFNLLGPLCNPAGAPYQLLGVGMPDFRDLLAEALGRLGTTRSLVVSGEDGLGEVTLSAATLVTEVTPQGLNRFVWNPSDFGLSEAPRDTLLVENPQQSAEVIRKIFSGQPGPPRDVVILNAAAAIWTVDGESSLLDCAARAAEAIDNGAAQDLLAQLIEVSNR